jgi:clan AA aspartic protease
MARVLGGNGVGRVTIDLEVTNYEDVAAARSGALPPGKIRHVVIKAVVDSGATRFVLPAKIVKQLGLPIGEKVKVRYADGREATRPVALAAQVTILGRTDTFSAVIEPNRRTALIGAIILEDLDLLVDCAHNRLVPRDPKYVISEIE